MAAASGRSARPPFPPFLSDADPLNYPFWTQYVVGFFHANLPPGFRPFGHPPAVAVQGEESILREYASLVLAGDEPASLLRLTDFAPGATGRYAAACDAFLAAAEGIDVAPLQRLCSSLGTLVRTRQVTDLKVDAIRLVRGKECALPSLAYGALPDDDTTPLDFTWPSFAARPAGVQQPCVGAFLHVQARGNRGWLFPKAAADLAMVPFPYVERDPVHGSTGGPDGAPRGEYVTTRQIFESGTSIYLGTSPMWLLPRDLIGKPLAQIAPHFDESAPACDLSQAAPRTPCILPPQRPFLFPTLARSLWLRQTLDATHPQFKPRAQLDRNPAELLGGEVTLGRMLRETFLLFARVTFDESPAELSAIAERLSAIFHVLRLYQGRADVARLQIAVAELGNDYVLAIPDQGYLQIGTPTPELYQRLTTTDLDAALDLVEPNCAAEAFTFQDLAR